MAFDEAGKLLVRSIAEAEACIRAMQRYVDLLHAAITVAPYMVMDDTYQEKRYGILGQLVNQGRSLALHETGDIVEIIRQRASAHDLNRGLSIALPYFDDQELQLCLQKIVIVPSGRISFEPDYLVQAARREAVLVGQDTHLSLSTRYHLLAEIRMLEKVFSDQ